MATPFRTPPSCKSKQTTITLENTNANIYTDNNSYIDISSTKALKKLSMSFYGQQTIKNNKKFIYDKYDIFTEAGNLDLLGVGAHPKQFQHSIQRNQKPIETRKIATSIPRVSRFSQSKKKNSIKQLGFGNNIRDEKEFQNRYLKDLMKPTSFNQTNRIMYKKDRKPLNKKNKKSGDKNISKSRYFPSGISQSIMGQRSKEDVALALKEQRPLKLRKNEQ